MSSLTTRFRDTKLSHEWFEKLMRDNPIQAVIDKTTGQPNGNYLTGPVRLSWCEQLYKPKANDAGDDVYGTALLWPHGQDMKLLLQAVATAAMVGFPQNNTAQGFVWHGLQTPFHDQAEKMLKYSGYLNGAIYANATTRIKPRIVDTRMNDIVDMSKIYPGVLAIAAVNAYKYDNKKKGISLGLQSVMIIGDDTNIGGGKAANPAQDFAGIAVQQDTNVSGLFAAGAASPPMPAQQSQDDLLKSMGLA